MVPKKNVEGVSSSSKKKSFKEVSNKFSKHKIKFVHKIKTHRSELYRFLIILCLLIFVYVAFTFIFQIRGSYAEQIMMEINPQYESFSLRHGDEETLFIETDINTNLFCNCHCDYEFSDLSRGVVLEEGNFSFSNYKNFEFDTVLSVDKLGSGQDLFLFEVNCRIEESRMCAGSNVPIMRSSLITLNYEPSEEDLLQKEELELLIDEATSLFTDAQSNILSAEARLNNFSVMKTDHLHNQIFKMKLFENVLEQDLENINDIWFSQNFSLIRQELSDNKLLEKAIHFNEESNNLISLIESERKIHNSAIDVIADLNESMAYFNDLRRIILLSDRAEPSPSLFNLYSRSVEFRSNFVDGDFEFYSDLNSSLTDILNLKKSVNESYIDILNNGSDLLVESFIIKNLVGADLCVVQNLSGCDDYLIDTSALDDLNGTSHLINYSDQFCDDVSDLVDLRDDLFLRINSSRDNISSSDLDDADLEKLYVEYFFLQEYKDVFEEGSYEYDLLDNISLDFERDFSINTSNLSEARGVIEDYDVSDFVLPSSYLGDELDDLQSICSFEGYSLPKTKVSFEPYIEINISASNVSFIDDVSATCCFKSSCSACCDYADCREALRNPLVVVHGYSFYSYNSAFHSANAFNDFSKEALKDSLYFPAGVIGPRFHPDYELYDLVKSGVPPLFKATYYDVLSFEQINQGEYSVRSFSIRDYADNLNSLIELVKNVTGKSQVDIVAHSMGGLVTRAYIDKYGDDSLNKIVLVGTPNHGVPLRLLYLCKFFGGLTECDEMYEGSAFMDYINDEANIPQKETHMLIGQGCDTYGADGDGIVQTSSAELNFTTNHYFESSCGLIDNFHRDMIKPSKYPEIYDTIIEILLS